MFGNQKLNGSKVPAFWRSNSDFAPPFLDTGELLAWYKGGTADGLTLIDKVENAYVTTLADVSCLSFNGTDSYVDLNHTITGGTPLDITIEFNSGSTLGVQGLWGCGGHTGLVRGMMFRANGVDFQVYTANGSISSLLAFAFPDITTNTDYVVRLQWDGTSNPMSLTVNGQTNSSTGTPNPWTGESDQSLVLGAYNGGATAHLEGLIYSFQEEGISQYPIEEVSGSTVYDVSGNGNHGTIEGATWTTADGIPSWNHSKGFTRISSLYQVTVPADGWEANRTFDPITANTAKLMDSLATVGYDQAGDPDGITYTVTPTTWLRTFDPNGSTLNDFFDVLGTLMQDIVDGNTTDEWSVSEPVGGRVRAYDPNTDNLNTAYDFMGTLILDLSEAGIIKQ